jgi:uncharacterized protein (UPF0276 family)
MRSILESRPPAGWLEVHAENYMAGPAPLSPLLSLRRDYPISVHGVGMSLGSPEPMDRAHALRLCELVNALDPIYVSEHLSFSSIAGVFTNALLPIRYDQKAIDLVACKLIELEDLLDRQVLIENPSRYLSFCNETMSEPQFLSELVERTGCGLLCDINNVYVSAFNLGFDAGTYLEALPRDAIHEIHLAGHSARRLSSGDTILLDDHASAVAGPVWSLYGVALSLFGSVPTLVEWDSAIPDLPTLLGEAARADRVAAAMAPGEAWNAKIH